MQDNQKDLIRASLEQKLEYYDLITPKLEDYRNFKQWLKNTIIANTKPKLIMFGTSKQSLLLNFKEQINFPQKDFLEIVKCMDCYTGIYDENFNSIPYNNRAYYMDEEHPKFKKFMLSVGLLDVFKKGYVFTGVSCYNISTFITHSGERMQHSLKSLFDMHNSMSVYNINNITNVQELLSMDYYLNSMVDVWEHMESYGIEKIKTRILEVLESEKSK